MINRVTKWHRVELHEIKEEDDKKIYIWWHFWYNNFYDNKRKKQNYNCHFWEVQEVRESQNEGSY